MGDGESLTFVLETKNRRYSKCGFEILGTRMEHMMLLRFTMFPSKVLKSLHVRRWES